MCSRKRLALRIRLLRKALGEVDARHLATLGDQPEESEPTPWPIAACMRSGRKCTSHIEAKTMRVMPVSVSRPPGSCSGCNPQILFGSLADELLEDAVQMPDRRFVSKGRR